MHHLHPFCATEHPQGHRAYPPRTTNPLHRTGQTGSRRAGRVAHRRAWPLGCFVALLFLWTGGAAAAGVEVRPGDTLSALAQRHGVSVADLRRSSGVSGDLVRVGDRLELPPRATCEVRPGDSLAALAQRHETDLGTLMRANGLGSPVVNPGTRLELPNSVPAEHLVRAGDTLYDIALEYGVSVEALVAINGLEGEVIRPGQRLRLRGASTPATTEVEVVVQPGDSLWAIARTHDLEVADLLERNALTASAVLRPGDRLRLPVHGQHVASTGAAAVREIVVQPGDTLSGLARRHGTTVAALVSANGLRGSRILVGQRLRVLPGSELAPAALEAVPPGAPRGLIWPVGGVVTSRFGYRSLRVNGSNFHNALDIDGVTGDPVLAAAAGTVSFSGTRGSYGRLVTIRSGAVEYRYAHNSELLVRAGDRVSAGQTIALVGNTGLSFGDHVHFEVRLAGRPIDPAPLMQPR